MMNSISSLLSIQPDVPDSTITLAGSPEFLQQIETLAERIRNTGGTILIEGETGTGKSLIARFLYERSTTYKKKLRTIALNEIPETLFESELFGQCQGACRGAAQHFEGKIKSADGGTIILKNIERLPMTFQAKMLRLIQDKEFERTGETETVRADVRIIATSNQPLAQLVRRKSFRADLFYRLNVIRIELPPLRRKIREIESLALHFLRTEAIAQGKALREFSAQAMDCIRTYDWPGNTRQLMNDIVHIAAMSDFPTEIVDINALPMHLRAESGGRDAMSQTPGRGMKKLEREHLIHALIRNNWNKVRTATELQISRRTLYNKIEDYGITEHL